MGALSSGGLRFGAACVFCFGATVLAPMACLSGGYTFDLTGTGGAAASSTTATTSPSSSSTSTGSTGGGGATTTSSSSTGGATSTSATTSSSSGGPPCASHDCSDPTCAASFKCVPTASTLPSGWTGYFALYDGLPSGVPGCSGTWPTQAFEGNGQLTSLPATCNSMCGTPTGGTCQIPELDISDAACTVQGVCSGPVTPPTGYTPGACFNFPASPPGSGFTYFGGSTCGPQTTTNCSTGTKPCNVSAAVGPGTVAGSSCAPIATAPTLPAVTWGSTGQACGGATPGTGCGSSDTCMPIPESPFVSSGVCIMQAGNQTCPAGQFTDQHIFYAGTTDTRACTTGSCGAATSDTCTVEWTLYSDTSATPNCTTLQMTVDSGKCAAFTGGASVQITSAKAKVTVPPNGGSCTPVDGQPTGSVTPTGATTFCCIP